MVINRYRSDYPNHVHQLLISLSKHYYIRKTGDLKYRKKSFDFTLKNVSKSDRIHVVYYLLRDHFSGLYYAEMYPHDGMINLGEFLFRAWLPKRGQLFYGYPKMLMVPQLVVDLFPGILDLLNDLKIRALKPKSGFSSGTVDIKNFEGEIHFYGFVEKVTKFSSLQENSFLMCLHAADKKIDREKINKQEKWLSKKVEYDYPHDLNSFKNYF